MASQVKELNQEAKNPTLLDLTRGPAVTLSDVAREAGVTLSYVSACAHGRKRPSSRVQLAAERLLGRPADQLFPPVVPGV
jgi:transcriptional regulator with XRE-family HTH domain